MRTHPTHLPGYEPGIQYTAAIRPAAARTVPIVTTSLAHATDTLAHTLHGIVASRFTAGAAAAAAEGNDSACAVSPSSGPTAAVISATCGQAGSRGVGGAWRAVGRGGGEACGAGSVSSVRRRRDDSRTTELTAAARA